jgi:long-chain acyl-CoA synthetase
VLVQDILQNSRLQHPDKVALVCGGRRLTYADLDSMADRLANGLLAHSIRRGDRVAILLPNSVEAVIAIFAILKAGATFVFLNRSMKFDKLSHVLGDCQASGLFISGQSAGPKTIGKLREANPWLKWIVTDGAADGQPGCDDGFTIGFESILNRFPDTRPKVTATDLDLACLVYTSGSTAEPKGVMCDHSNVLFVCGSVTTYLENRPEDVLLNVLPLSFGYGLYQVFMAFLAGGTLVLESSFAFPAGILQRIAEERVTGFAGVPTIFATLLQIDLSGFDLSSLRYVTNAAAALPPAHIRQLQSRLPRVQIYSMYGLTETKRALYLPPDQLDRRPGSVGIAIPGTEVWIEGPEGQRLGPDEIGELVVRGRHVMRGYWQAPEATAARFRPGPLPGERVCYTGDLFRMDQDGYMYFVGRKDDIIKTRGEKASPREIENVLCTLPGVIEAAVVGVPDPFLGEAIKAVLVADTARVTKSAVLAHCKAHLEDFMIPKYVEFREELPKTSSGKTYKQGLRECAGLLES